MNTTQTYETEETLLEALREGDPGAFEKLYRLYYVMVARLAAGFSTYKEGAEDLFQEVLFILVCKLQSPDFQLTAKLSTFLYAIARNLLLKKTGAPVETALKDEHLFRLEGDSQQVEELEQRTQRENQIDLVTGCLELLEEDCRRLLLLSFFEKRSQAEIAVLMGYSEAFVKVKKHRCLDYLRKEVKKHESFKHP